MTDRLARCQSLRLELKAIRKAGLVTSSAKLEKAILQATGADTLPGGSSNFDKFLRGEFNHATIEVAAEELIAKFLYRTRLGRVLRQPTDAAESYDSLIDPLLAGHASRPQGSVIEGRYFVYHGSYAIPDHAAIHLLDITFDGEAVLKVTDTIMDGEVTPETRRLTSYGAVTFFGKSAQILTYRDPRKQENRSGYSLIVTSQDLVNDREPLDGISGDIFGMHTTNEVFRRKILIVKASRVFPALVEKDDLALKTGIFPFEKILSEKYNDHLPNFRKLAKSAQKSAVSPSVRDLDPAVAWAEKLSAVD